jgi:hypothetical protein
MNSESAKSHGTERAFIGRNAPPENKKEFAAVSKTIENKDPAVSDTRISCCEKSGFSGDSGRIGNGDQIVGATGDSIVPALSSLDAQEVMRSTMLDDQISTGPPESSATESKRPAAWGSNTEQGTQTFETENASALIKETVESKGPTATDTSIPSCDKLDVPGDKDYIEIANQMVTATYDRIEPKYDPVDGQETMESRSHEVISSTEVLVPENAESRSNSTSTLESSAESEDKLFETEKVMTTEVSEPDDRTLPATCIGRNEKSDFPCDDNATKHASQSTTSEYDSAEQLDILRNDRGMAIADLTLLTQCNSVDKPDLPPRENEELLASTDDTLSTQCSIEGDVSIANVDDVLATQYKSGDEEALASEDDLLSTQCSFIADNTVGNFDDMVLANSSIFERCCEDDNMENLKETLSFELDMEELDDPRDEKTLESANQTESSSVTYGNGKQCDLPSSVIVKEMCPDSRKCNSVNKADEETMECNESTMNIIDCRLAASTHSRRDVSEQLHVPCDNIGTHIPFLQRNRKRTFRRMREPKISSLQSILRSNQISKAVRSIAVCAPELNVPSRKKSTNIHRHSHYRVHILTNETNGRVITTTMSFCLALYQCHFCVFNGVRSNSFSDNVAIKSMNN